MRHLLLTLIFLLSFTGCQDKNNDAKEQAAHDAKIIAETRAKVLAEVEVKNFEEKKYINSKKPTQFNQIGIDMRNGTISIDTNKTKDFFNTLNQKVEAQMKKISDDLQKGMIDLQEEGLQINDTQITIDLNKTKNLLEIWGQKIQVFAQEFEDVTKSLDINTSKGN